MTWTITTDPEAFLAATEAFLRAAPAENTVTLTTVEALRGRDPEPDAAHLLGWSQPPGGAVGGAFILTPPYPVNLSAMPPPAVVALAGALHDDGREITGVHGSLAEAEAFAGAWTERTGDRSRLWRRMRLHRLDALVAPDPGPPGEAVVAGAEHRDLAVAWFRAFAAEIEEPPRDVVPLVEAQIDYGGLMLWLVDGEPVSLAGRTRLVAGMLRVAPVYTPPEHRGRGYGAGATTAVTRVAIDAGAEEILLFTDLANPTSNRLYQRLGYSPVAEIVSLRFES
jgi:GNAT superfamily N-acetyltransferase